MSLYPLPAGLAESEIYTSRTETTPQYALGSICQVNTDNGVMLAQYVRNAGTASIAAGVGLEFNGAHKVVVVAGAVVNANLIVGGAAASFANSTAGGYGWAIIGGPQTNAWMGATLASSAAPRALACSSGGGILTTVASTSTLRVHAMLRANASTVATGTAGAATSGAIVDWLWR